MQAQAATFDTHAFVKRLTRAGMPEDQAEVLANGQADLYERLEKNSLSSSAPSWSSASPFYPCSTSSSERLVRCVAMPGSGNDSAGEIKEALNKSIQDLSVTDVTDFGGTALCRMEYRFKQSFFKQRRNGSDVTIYCIKNSA